MNWTRGEGSGSGRNAPSIPMTKGQWLSIPEVETQVSVSGLNRAGGPGSNAHRRMG